VLRARFGLLPNAWNGALGEEQRTDGVAFVVEWTSAPDGGGTTATSRELWRQVLRPQERALDRGVQSLELDLPQGPGQLVLRTLNVSGLHQEFDWGFWSRVEVR
jgi:poly(3-hydroxyalkanoate) synthetase